VMWIMARWTEAAIVKPLSAARPARTMAGSTGTILCGVTLTGFLLPSEYAMGVFAAAAIGVGLSLTLATVIEAMAGVRNLIRTDVLILWSLYGLTLLEFLLPQSDVDAMVSPAAATSGTYAVLVGFAGLALGRHLVPRGRASRRASVFAEVRPASFLLLFVLATLLGYLHVFLAVNFDPFEAVRQMSLPRFSQSWGRGRYGDAYSLLYELGALIWLIPPLAGIIYARSRDYNLIQKVLVTIILLFTLYYGFSSGTRYVLVGYVTTFFGAYLLNKGRLKFKHVLYMGVVLGLLLVGTAYMLKFRTTGLGNFSFADSAPDTLSIDYNIVVISRLTEVFPNSYEFLGLEIPFYSLIHPIPRVFWPGKPEGLSVSVEEALGADGAHVTITSSFVGEAYISGGLVAVLFISLLFGAGAEMWNRVGRDINSPFAQLLYASGLFCAAFTMRSMVWLSAAMLPTLALWLFGKLWLSSARRPAAGISSNRSSVHCLRSGYPPDKG